MAQSATAGLAIEPVLLPDMALGPRDAAVTIVEYSSLTCSHCATFAETIFPMLRSKYTDTGRVRFVFREFPLDQKAAAGSMLARCAANGDAARYFGAVGPSGTAAKVTPTAFAGSKRPMFATPGQRRLLCAGDQRSRGFRSQR
jgi:protein-disulfide isomerase